MRVFLFSLINWLCDDSNLIKALLTALAVLLILIFFFSVYYHKIQEKFYDRGRYRPYKRLRSNWEPERPNDLTNSFDNPWDVVSDQNDTEQQADSSSKGGVKIAIFIAILAVLALVVFLIVKRMGI